MNIFKPTVNIAYFEGKPTVSFTEWEKIDEVEVQRGGHKKPREKIVDITEMLQIAKSDSYYKS